MADLQKDFSFQLYENSRVEWKAMLIALFLTVLIHGAIFAAIPSDFLTHSAEENFDNLELEILPPELEKLEEYVPPQLPEYVEANPNANSEKPLHSNMQESYKDQRAAQEIPDPNADDPVPTVDGEMDTKKIVEGNLDDALSAPQKVFETLERPLENQSASQVQSQNMQIPFENFAEKKPENSAAISDSEKNISLPAQLSESEESVKKADNEAMQTEEKSENKEDVKEEKIEAYTPEQNLPTPQARPSLNMKVPAGPLMQSNMASNQIGTTAIDSRFSEFGAYQQRMQEAIVRQWYLLASRYDLGAAYNSVVAIEFTLDKNGEITSFKVVFNTSTATGQKLCEQAIISTAPYGPWTEEMVRVFAGQNQSVKFQFFYR